MRVSELLKVIDDSIFVVLEDHNNVIQLAGQAAMLKRVDFEELDAEVGLIYSEPIRANNGVPGVTIQIS